MMPIPDIEILWNFNDIEASEAAFRRWLGIVERDPSHTISSQILALAFKTQIARTYSLRGRFTEAHALLDEVEPQQTLAPVVQVRYLLERGRTFNSDNQSGKARPLFEQAWEIARSKPLDYLAVDAAHMVAIVADNVQDQIVWSEKALHLTETSPAPYIEKWHGALYNNLGWTYHDDGQYEKALEIFQKGVIWREKQGEIKPLRIAKWTVGRALRSLKRYKEALDLQEKLLADYQSTGDDDGFVHEELGECLLALNRAEEARASFAQAYQLLKDISWVESDRLARIQSLGEK